MTRVKMYALSVAGGVAAGLAWNGISGFVLFIAFIPLFFVDQRLYLRGERVFSVFPYAFACFVSWNIVAVWWLSSVHLVGGAAVIILNTLLMTFVFLLFAVTRKIAGERSAYASFIFYWLAYEYLLLWGDLSWPWLHLGNGFASGISHIQWYEYTGAAGGSLWVLLVNVLLFSIWRSYINEGKPLQNAVKIVLTAAFVAVPLIVSQSLFNRIPENNGGKVRVTILQPNLDPYTEKFEGTDRYERAEDLADLAALSRFDETDIIIAPETAVDSVWIGKSNPHLGPLKKLLEEGKSKSVILGATLFEEADCNEPDLTLRKCTEKDICFRIYNSSIQLSPKDPMQIYHKIMLVPGVENLPFHRFMPVPPFMMLDLGGVAGIYSRGDSPGVFSCPSGVADAGQLICFESAYGRLAADVAAGGAGILVIITNDGWFRGTNGYLQHLRKSQLRAIETRRPVARSANTGISAIIDSRGIIVEYGNWQERTVVEGGVVPGENITFYVASGDYIGRIALLFTILILLSLAVRYLSGRTR